MLVFIWMSSRRLSLGAGAEPPPGAQAVCEEVGPAVSCVPPRSTGGNESGARLSALKWRQREEGTPSAFEAQPPTSADTRATGGPRGGLISFFLFLARGKEKNRMYVGREIEEEEKGELEVSPRRLNKGALAPFPHNKPLKCLSGSSLF